MPTKISVWNEALVTFLEIPALASDALTSEAARSLDAAWIGVVRRCLEREDWNFALKRQSIARTGTPPFGFANYYNLPGDCARLVWLSSSGKEDDTLVPGSFVVERNAVYTDAATLYAKFVTYDACNVPGRWTENFAHMVAAELALACRKLNNDSTKISDAERKIAGDQALTLDHAVEEQRMRRTPNAQFRNIVRRCLERGEWNFALLRVQLTPGGDGVNPFGFANFYNLPVDCARVVWVSETGDENTPMVPGRYKIEGGGVDGSGNKVNKLLTDSTTVYIRYVSYTYADLPTTWSANFENFVQREMNMLNHLDPKQAGSAQVLQTAIELAEKQALSVDAVQSQTKMRKPGSWATANRRRSRGGGAGGLPEQQI